VRDLDFDLTTRDQYRIDFFLELFDLAQVIVFVTIGSQAEFE